MEQPLLKVPLRRRPAPGDALIERRVAHERERVRRRAQEVAGGALAFSESPLGVGFGTHYAEIYMGIPAQRASVIVDTGSHLTALPCSSCSGCGEHTDPLFDVSKSTTAKYLTCSAFGSCNACEEDKCYISQSYTEGSMWEAVVVDELVWVGGFEGGDNADAIVKHFGVRFPLGCQTKETGLFITQKENGIMGMGRHSATVMAHLLNAGRITHDLFSLCFDRAGGEMVLGGIDYSHHTTDVSYTPLLPSSASFYPVRVKEIRVAGQSIGASEDDLNTGKGVIVDSGTTDTFFVSSASRGFQSAFQSASGGIKYSENKMVLSDDDLLALPTITIVLDGMDGQDDVELYIPAEKYLTPSDNGKFYYGNFHFTERSGGVLGASSMIGLDVIFDSENKRVGFAESLCGQSAATWANKSIVTGDGSEDGLPPANTTTTSSGTVTAVFDSATEEVDGRRSSPSFGAFIAQVLIITLVGIVIGVVLWTRRKRRLRSWAAIPELDSSRGSRAGDSSRAASPSSSMSPTADEGKEEEKKEEQELPRVPARALSPPLSTASSRKAFSPRFTIGSDDEDDERGERTEL